MKDRYSPRFVRRAAVLACASLPAIAVGATKNFVGQNASSYYWSIGSNWSPSGVPGSSDYAYIQPSSYHAFYLLDYNYTPSTGPISITRAFVPDDWHRLLARAGIPVGAADVQRVFPYRLCVGRIK